MTRPAGQILTVAQMREAEAALIARGSSVDALMQIAGRGAAEWVWRVAGHRPVSVLCGPGNNGGDGYVIAEAIRERGGEVVVIAAAEPNSDAARNARALYRGEVVGIGDERPGEVLVDCLFGSGLTRPLSPGHAALLVRLAGRHSYRIAVDLPSGVRSDEGYLLNDDLPRFDLTIALGAWKFAHMLMPARARMGRVRLVGIGVDAVTGAARVVARPQLAAPAPDAHKYRRGMLAIVGGAMPGAALLAARAAQGGGAGYVKLFAEAVTRAPDDLVVDAGPLRASLSDPRHRALLVGPGLGRDQAARGRLEIVLAEPVPAVLDADALVLLAAAQIVGCSAVRIATPHEGELDALELAFGCAPGASKPARALALAKASGMVIVAKGPDTLVAASDGRIACAEGASSWLSTAGTGDVLAGVIASRLAAGVEPFAAACEGVWLHAEAARRCGPAFSAGDLANAVPAALGACL